MDIKQAFSDEVRRLARKEIKLAVAPLLETVSDLRRLVAEQKKRIAALEKRLPNESANEKISIGDEFEQESGRSVRINAAGIVRLRNKLGLTQAEFAKVVGVAMHTVSVWEQGRRIPRKAQKVRICALRKVGKRELKRRLAEAVEVREEESGEA